MQFAFQLSFYDLFHLVVRHIDCHHTHKKMHFLQKTVSPKWYLAAFLNIFPKKSLSTQWNWSKEKQKEFSIYFSNKISIDLKKEIGKLVRATYTLDRRFFILCISWQFFRFLLRFSFFAEREDGKWICKKLEIYVAYWIQMYKYSPNSPKHASGKEFKKGTKHCIYSKASQM